MTQTRAPSVKKSKRLHLPLILASVALLSSCASNKTIVDQGDIVISDPFEKGNRITYAFNKKVDKYVIHPTVRGYRTVFPPIARTGIRNFLQNLSTPANLANQLLQGDLDGAGTTAKRFSINTLLGLGGIVDIAGYEGIKHEHEDFGQTLAVWGVPHGPYFVTPFFGASTMRDYTGFVVDSVALDPVGIYWNNTDQDNLNAIRFGVNYLNLRDFLMDTEIELQKSAIDDYAAIRNSYYQYRDSLVKDQKKTNSYTVPEIPDYDDADYELDY